MQAHNNMCITIHISTIYYIPSWREAFCFSRPWIKHTFLPSVLSSIMHSLLSVSKYDHPCGWLNEWADETMAALFFSTLRHWHSYLPRRHFHLPAPPPPLMPSLCSYPIQRLLFISLQSSQSSQDSQPASQPERHTTTEDVLLPFYWCMERNMRHSKPQPLPLPYGSLLFPFCYC